MSKKGPILLIDDDADEFDLFKEALSIEKIENELICFSDANKAFSYLKHTLQKPFLIISDINLPGINGIEFRKKLHEDNYLRQKSIPFIFFTTTAGPGALKEAYEMNVQGFFEKPSSMHEISHLIRHIYDYWQICRHPNNGTPE